MCDSFHVNICICLVKELCGVLCYSSLLDNIRELPEIVIAKMLVRPLLKRFVVEEKIARDQVLPKLLTPKTNPSEFI